MLKKIPASKLKTGIVPLNYKYHFITSYSLGRFKKVALPLGKRDFPNTNLFNY